MKKSKIRFKNSILLTMMLAFCSYGQAQAAISLPDPTTTYDGLPVVQQYDDFLSYSAKLLDLWGYAGFDTATGVGGLDVVLYTHANGIDNDPVNGGFVFEDPQSAAAGGTSSFSGTWGAGNEPNGPVTVDNLLAYLKNQFGPAAAIPVFTFDMSESGNNLNQNLQMVARVDIFDPVTNTVIESWSLDANPNSAFDASAYITVFGNITVTGASLTEYSVSNNIGSGKMDFLVVAPTMNLELYKGKGYQFRGFLDAKSLNGGGEELFISGAFTFDVPPPPPPVIPEPATMILSLLGCAGAITSKRILGKKKV